jgi:hypothetical protein
MRWQRNMNMRKLPPTRPTALAVEWRGVEMDRAGRSRVRFAIRAFSCLLLFPLAAAALVPPARAGRNEPPIAWDPQPLTPVHLQDTRPRIWFTAAQLPVLRQRCQKPAYQDALQKLIKDAGETSQRPQVRAVSAAFLYQMTGKRAYARQAIELARGVKPYGWVNTNANAAHQPFGDSYTGLADPLACVFDWCYDALRPEEKAAIGGVLHDQLSKGPYRIIFHEPWWIPVWLSDIIALHNSGIDEKMVDEQLAACNRCVHQFVAFADEIHADGATGDYHGQIDGHMHLPELWLQATGESLFAKCGFYHNQPYYPMYLLLPDKHLMANDGDGPTDGLGGCDVSFRQSADYFGLYAARNDNPAARWVARHASDVLHSRWTSAWQQILWDDGNPDEKPLTTLPPVRYFPSNGLAILRSGWDLSSKSTDTVAAFYCRPSEGHSHLDAGHFVIWRGLDQLVQRNGYYASPNSVFHANFFVRTIAHNCPTILGPPDPSPRKDAVVNDGGQVLGDTRHYPIAERLLKGVTPWRYKGEIGTFVDTARYSYVFADITPAYSTAKAEHVVRSFLWLKPDTFVICDRVKATEPNYPKRWLLNVSTAPCFDGHEKIVAGSPQAGILESTDTSLATVERGKSKLFMQALLPERRLMRRLGGEGYSYWCDGKNWEPPDPRTGNAWKLTAEPLARKFWRIEIEPLEKSAETVYLNVLDIAAAEMKAPPAATASGRDGVVTASFRRPGLPGEVVFLPDGRVRIDGEMAGKPCEPLKANRLD